MASTFPRPGSSVLQLAINLPDGKRVQRSLHTANQKHADKIAGATQALCDELDKGADARQTVLKVLVEDIFIAAKVPNPWDVKTVEQCQMLGDFAAAYLARKAKRLSESSLGFMSATLTHFSGWFARPIAITGITGQHCQSWYDALVSNVTAATANNRLACVSAMFNQAKKTGVVPSNPCEGIQVQDAEDSTREALSDAEIQQLNAYLADKPKGPSWVTAVTLARYAGLRLQDAAHLQCSNVVPAGDGLALFFVARKTGSEVTVPCLPDLAARLKAIRWDDPASPSCLCPELCDRSASSLSSEFTAHLEAAGIDTGEATVNGRVKRSKGFHSLRHSFCSSLAKAGVPEDLRAIMAGHSNVKTHRGYVHADAANMAERLAAFVKGGAL